MVEGDRCPVKRAETQRFYTWEYSLKCSCMACFLLWGSLPLLGAGFEAPAQVWESGTEQLSPLEEPQAVKTMKGQERVLRFRIEFSPM